MRTAQKLGVKTVAVYSDADVNSMHTAMADEAFRLGEPPSASSYLLGDRIIDIAKRCGAEGIHPGYGFLSENANFANACAAANIEFIGPPASAIISMGSKSESKKIMEAAGVPCVPGYHGDAQDVPTLMSEAERIGYPVMLKAVMGGGGKGMRVVNNAEEFVDALESAKREAMASFADDRFLVEKFVVKPRHVELQVFADKQGNCVHLFERDCSLQRRHQKVIEEAPAPHMTEELRKKMGDAAVAAAKAVGDVGAGTVECILDARGDFFFMEMNTRLQVEHPVTEMITGQDLVQWQLLVAAGNPLPLRQEQLQINGHSFEARIYAENPAAGFLPATGTLHHLASPFEGDTVRVETGVAQGDTVSIHYDPMIAKLVVWDQDRHAALRKLKQCLGQYHVVGVPTNIEFLTSCASNSEFEAGLVDTSFIDRHIDTLLPPASSTDVVDSQLLALGATGLVLRAQQEAVNAVAGNSNVAGSPWSNPDTWRMNYGGTSTVEVVQGDSTQAIAVQHGGAGEGFQVQVGLERLSTSGSLDGDAFSIICDGTRHKGSLLVHDSQVNMFFASGRHFSFGVPESPYASASSQSAQGGMIAPMPGKVVKIMVELSDFVTAGTPIMAMEAMKMEHVIKAPCDGVVDKILYKVGDQVEEKQVLVRFEEES